MRYSISFLEDPTIVSGFLEDIWGKCIISDCDKLVSPGDFLNKTELGPLAVGAYVDEGLAGMAALKLLDLDHIEFGALAIGDDYRNMGISTSVYAALQPIAKYLYDQGTEIFTYATLGSAIIHRIIDNIRWFTEQDSCKLLSFFPFLVEVDKEKGLRNLKAEDFVYIDLQSAYISTCKIASSKRLKNINLDVSFDDKESTWGDNNLISLPIRLDILKMRRPDISDVQSALTNREGRQLQVIIPNTPNFKKIFQTILDLGFIFNGFDIQDGKVCLSLVYDELVDFRKRFFSILTLVDEYNIPEFSELISEIRNINCEN